MVRTVIDKTIFLDRDGVLNKAIVINNKPKSPKNSKELVLNKKIKKILSKAKKNYYLICITDQPEVGRNKFIKKDIEEINQIVKNYFGLDDILTCYHERDKICDCRKPNIGMLEKAKDKFSINFKKSIVIGDRWRDVSMGKKVGCKTIFVDYKYDETLKDQPDIKINNLKELENYVPI